MIRAVLFSLLFASISFGQSVTLPARVEVEPGRLAGVIVQWEGDDINWIASPELDVFREYDPDPAVVRLRVLSAKTGTFKIVAVTCKDKKLSPWASCEVVVGKPGPGPEPGPEPGPDPADPMVGVLQSAFRSDKGEPAEKAEWKTALVSVYKSAKDVDLSKVKTASQLFSMLRASSAAVLKDSQYLFSTRTAIILYLKEALPSKPDAELTDDHRKAAKALFTKLANALEVVK